MRRLSAALLIITALGCAKKVPLPPGQEIRGNGYVIIQLEENKFFVAAREESRQEAIDKICTRSYICSHGDVGSLIEVERIPK